ncbi:MAG: 2-oxoglutarate dehydrogenase complex dihydrolipoyllysine-residue succinyltransferase [Gammaproteobacteria bacterium]|nr:2-oxoglutarate dehydrogenase complex dihydrolipoyllysine-residue succinyltransferase [Gammaproteobacteria bacterium]
MLIEVKVPILAESVPDATLLDWYKQVGEAVARGENLIDLETDKVTLEVTAPESGVLKEIRKQTGDVVVTDDILAVIDTEATASVAAPAADAKAETSAGEAAAPAEAAARSGPAARKLAEEHGVDLNAVSGTGTGGRVTKADVVAHVERGAAAAEAAPAETPVPTVEANVQERQPAADTTRVEERVPMTRLRKRAAERLLAAQRDNALLTTFNEVNMQPVMDLRSRYKDDFEQRYGVRLGFMSFFVKAAVEALKKFPVVNASVDADDIIYHGYFDVGVAVGSERGLVVPILRDVERMAFAEVERRIRDFGERARDGKLTIDELTGGTFTISNGGVYGSLVSTPIINPPQSAILGMHKIQERPVAENGQVVIRPMMYLALSYDHRIIDGREAVQFLDTIRRTLEEPTRMLLAI